MPNHFSDLGFGITLFAGQFHQDWEYSGTAEQIIRTHVHDQTLQHVSALADDVERLLRVNDQGDFAETLWVASTGGCHRPRQDGISGRQWMQEIADVCRQRLHSASGYPPTEPYDEYADEVVKEVDLLAERLESAVIRQDLDGTPNVVDSLKICARHASAELAFRFLLRILSASNCDISAAAYARFVDLGHSFHYGEFIVSDTEYLVVE